MISWLQPYLAFPVAVFGGGISGRGSCQLVERLGGTSVVYDQSRGVGQSREFSACKAAGHRLVIFSPGFAPEHPWLQIARAAGCVCIGELDLAVSLWPGKVYGVTGTNGKTTMVELLAHAWRESGREAYAVGNVGHAFTELVATGEASSEAIAVCEVSSFQAETLQRARFHATLWTNFAEDHLERHPGMEAYFRAKYRLIERTEGPILYGPSVARWASALGLPLPPDGLVDFESLSVEPELAGSPFAGPPQRENYLLFRAFWLRLGNSARAALDAARSFAVGPHRLAYVGRIDGATFWNDSKATNFHAVEAALQRFHAPVILIAGGKSKGGDIAGWVARIAQQVRSAVVIGETADALSAAFAAVGVPVIKTDTMEAAVAVARGMSAPGDAVVLSPGFASFDLFNGYADRGQRFESAVRALSSQFLVSSISADSNNPAL
jgi:UDP-N-acetylmuramoylalanine--D-glutamate ligase